MPSTAYLATLYDAAARAGLLEPMVFEGRTVMVDFQSPDETVLDGFARSADYSIRFPRSELASLATGDRVNLSGASFRVRDIRAIGDGSEYRADLSRL